MKNFAEWIKNNIGYCIFILILTALMFLCIQETNTGHLYFGPSGTARYNQSDGSMISDRVNWQSEFINDSRNLWGISLRFELSEKDQKNNRKRTSGELINVKKDIEEPAQDTFAENIEITVSKEYEDGAEEQLGNWIVSVGEIRPQSDYKLVWT